MKEPAEAPLLARSERAGPFERFRRRAWAIATLDLMGLDRLPGRRWAAIAVAGATVAVFSGARLGIVHVWTESLPFMVIALAIGFLARTLAIGVVLLHAAVDLVRYLGSMDTQAYGGGPPEISPETFAGRIVSYWLLWVLIVTIPTAQRAVTAAIMERRRATTGARFIGAVAGAGAAGVLVFLWSNAQPYLVRAFFGGAGSVAAMLPQRIPLLLAGLATVMALGVAIARQRLALDDGDAIPFFELRGTGGAATLTRIALYGVAVILVLGLVTSVTDIVLLGVALLVGEVLAPRVARLSAYRHTLGRIHPLARFAAALVATFVIGQIIAAAWYQPLLGSEFFPLILSVALGLLVFRLILADLMTPATPPTVGPPGGRTVVTTSFLAAAALVLATPGVAFADDCSGLSDCANLFWAQVGAAVSAIAAALWTLISGIFSKTPPVISTLEQLASEEGAEAQRGAFLMIQDRVAKQVMAETNDLDEYDRIKNLPPGEFARELETGKWNNLGAWGGGGDGGATIGASRGCLPDGTLIATPDGAAAVEVLTPGMLVWTLQPDGSRAADIVDRVSSTATAPGHEIVSVVLDDGRGVRASADHPLADGRDVGGLTVGDLVDGARVMAVRRETYLGSRTHDVRTAKGAAYFAGGIPLLSTLVVGVAARPARQVRASKNAMRGS